MNNHKDQAKTNSLKLLRLSQLVNKKEEHVHGSMCKFDQQTQIEGSDLSLITSQIVPFYV